MEIFTLLETLEELLETSRNLPFSSKGIVDKDEMLDLIKEIRIKLPDELKQAKWVKEERQRILVEAQKEADDIVKEAENRIISMIDEHEIKLTQTEYNIIELLSVHAGRVLTYSEIIKKIWGYSDSGSIKKLQVNMANIRKKLGEQPGEYLYILNELGVGYRIIMDNYTVVCFHLGWKQ